MDRLERFPMVIASCFRNDVTPTAIADERQFKMDTSTRYTSGELKRKGEVEEISQFLDESTKYVTNIVNSLDWNLENIKVHVLQKNLPKCILKKSVITESCGSSRFFYEPSSSVISHLEHNEVVWPASISLSKCTSEQRLQDYNKTVEMAKSKRRSTKEFLDGVITEISHEQEYNEQQFKSELEKMAEQRDYKRRRQSYRAKNVHITKRSPTDIMREIIENQMRELEHSCDSKAS